ncbi:MAG: energy-coupled thiamine transporter ThiT [Lactovum sp.]
MSQSKNLVLAEVAIATALAYVLSFFTINIANSFYLEFAVIPLTLLAIRRGFKWGITAGLLYGALTLITGQGGNMVLETALFQFLDGLIEYILAPCSLAFAALFIQNKVKIPMITVAASIAALFKYFWHFIAGGIFWSAWAPEGWNAWLFSAWSQGLSGVITAFVSSLVLVFLLKVTPQLLKAKK